MSKRRRTKPLRIAAKLEVIEVIDAYPGMANEKWTRIAHNLRTKPKDWRIMLLILSTK